MSFCNLIGRDCYLYSLWTRIESNCFRFAWAQVQVGEKNCYRETPLVCRKLRSDWRTWFLERAKQMEFCPMASRREHRSVVRRTWLYIQWASHCIFTLNLRVESSFQNLHHDVLSLNTDNICCFFAKIWEDVSQILVITCVFYTHVLQAQSVLIVLSHY